MEEPGQWGLSQLLMDLIIVLEYIGRLAMGLLKPIETVGTAPGAIGDFIIIPLAAILFVFSIMKPKTEGY